MFKHNSLKSFGVFFFSVFPSIVFAQTTADSILDYFIAALRIMLPLLVGIAVVVFFWGMVKFIAHAGDETAIAEAKQLMVWGLIAVVVMVSFWGIIGFIQESFFAATGAPAALNDYRISPTHIP